MDRITICRFGATQNCFFFNLQFNHSFNQTLHSLFCTAVKAFFLKLFFFNFNSKNKNNIKHTINFLIRVGAVHVVQRVIWKVGMQFVNVIHAGLALYLFFKSGSEARSV